jgi:hypothetical protein
MATNAVQVREWTPMERTLLDGAPLIRVAATRADGSSRPFVVIGHVRIGDEAFIRSLRGTAGSWYRAATRSGRGRLIIDDQQVEVAFFPDTDHTAEIDAALHARYGNDAGVQQMTAPPAQAATLRIRPVA